MIAQEIIDPFLEMSPGMINFINNIFIAFIGLLALGLLYTLLKKQFK